MLCLKKETFPATFLRIKLFALVAGGALLMNSAISGPGHLASIRP